MCELDYRRNELPPVAHGSASTHPASVAHRLAPVAHGFSRVTAGLKACATHPATAGLKACATHPATAGLKACATLSRQRPAPPTPGCRLVGR